MPTVTQILAVYRFPLPPTPLEQLGEGAVIAGSTMVHESSDAFVWGRSQPLSATGTYGILEGSILFEGTGFVYDGGLLPASGTITSISVLRRGFVVDDNDITSSSPVVAYTGLSIDISDMRDELLLALNGDTGPLRDYFLGLQWTYEGSSTNGYGDHFEGGNLDDVINGNGGRDSLYGLGGDDILRGGDSDDHLFGGDGEDILIAYNWNDYLNGGAGADTLIGGSGGDWADYSGATWGVTVSLANPSLNTGDAKGDVFVSIENISGTDLGDIFMGDDGNNWFFGGKGNDFFIGDAGADTFYGGGYSPNDPADGFDCADYSGSTSGIVVSLSNTTINTGNAKNDTYRSIEDLKGSNFGDELYGTNGANAIKSLDGNDALKGYGGDDTLEGGAGNDTIDGGAGTDGMYGGTGNDVYIVDNIADRVVEVASSGVDRIESSVTYGLAGNHVESLFLTGSAAIDGTGNSLDNTVKGNSGRNNLDGSGGSDKINGGAGADRLTGGTGADQFIFSRMSDSTNAVSGRDTITDFARAQDRINLSLVDANTDVAGNQAFKFIGTAAYSHKAGELRYGINGNQTIVSGDVNGDGVADFKIDLDRSIALASADFVL